MSLIKIKTEPKRRSSWRRKLLWAGGTIAVLAVGLYFIGTSEMFLQKVILPQVSNAIKSDVTVGAAEVSPFRRVTLRDLKVHPRGNEPLLAVKEIRLRYSLWSIIRGQIEVEEVTVESPVITVVENADGTSNLDELLKLGGSEKKPSAESTSQPPQINVKLVALNNATVRLVKNHPGGTADVTEVSGLNFSVRDLKNGQAGKIEVAAQLAVDQAAQATVAAGSLRAKLGGDFTFELLADLKPASIKGDVTLNVEQATGALADLAALAVRFDCEATPTEVKQIALSFTKADVALGEVRISGPLDTTKLEGKLKLEVLSLDRRVLNLAGAASGIDFGPTTINSTTDIELAKSGKEISLAGRLNVANFQITRLGKTSPTLDLRCDYAVSVDQVAETAVLNFFNLSGTQNSQLFLQSELPSPLTIVWGKAGAGGSDAVFNLAVTGWNLADWQAFVGEGAPAGVVNTKLNLTSQQGGKQLQLALTGGVDKFSLKSGSSQGGPAEIRWQLKAQAADLKQFKLEDYRLEITQQSQSALVVSASGTFDGATQDADLQVAAQATLARLLAVAPQPGVTVSAGAVDFKSHLVGKGGSHTVTGQLALTDFTGGQGDLRLANYGASLDFDAAMKDNTLELRKVSGMVREGQKIGGRFDASGKLNLGEQVTGQVAVKLTDFNQDGLRPFLESALGGKKLVSVAINTTASVNLGAQGDTGIKADVSVTNLVVQDPINPQPAPPLQTRVLVDVIVAGSVAQIRQCQLTLTPTDRAKNELNLTGTADWTKADAVTGNLKLAAEALDFTRYYDLFAPKPATNAVVNAAKPAPKPAAASPPPPSEPEREPEAMVLPLQNFSCDVEIGHLYLHEVDISNWRSTAKVSGGQITLKPCKFAVNGGPVDVSVEADLGVPGYRYVVGFKAQSVPLTPLVNTFASDRAGQIGGQVFASLDLSGAGVTGASLQTNLTGQFNVLATNLNLSINNVRTPILNAIVNTIIGLPDLIAGLTGKRDAGQMKWADEITARPIDVLLVNGGAGNGKVEIKETQVNSAAFQVQCAGDIVLATVLTNSTLQFPVHVALGRPYAAKLGMVNASTPTNAAYILLPDFLTVKGTLGKVEPEISKTGLLKVAGKAVGGLGKETGVALGEAGKSIYGATSGFLKDRFGNTTTNVAPATETNTAAEPAKKSGILNLFKREKKE
jgi:uncharacterized protein involved in outer membrane biogenesis